MKTKITIGFIVCFFLVLAASSYAQLFKQLDQAYAKGQITVDEMMLNKIYRLFEPSKVNKNYVSEVTSAIKCGTEIITEYYNIKNNLNKSSVDIIENYLATDAELIDYISPEEYFKLSYTTSGPDAVPSVDADYDGVPDFIENIANYLDQSWIVQINNCGFEAPYDWDGDGHYNVYFQYMTAWGYTSNDDFEGTKIVLHNNFSNYTQTQDPEGDQIGTMKVTCAHEFKHASQFEYAQFLFNQYRWAELDAVWAEELVFDYVNQSMLYYTIANGYYSPFSAPIISLDDGGGGSYEDYYWEDFLHQKFDNNSYSTAPLLLAFMQRRQNYPSESVLDSYDYVLQNFGSSLQEAFTEFIVWNFYTGSCAVQGFGYDEAGITGFPQVLLKATHNSYPVSGSGSNLGHLSSNHILLYPGGQGGLRINFDGYGSAPMEAVVTWSNGSYVRWEKMDLGEFSNDGELYIETKTFGALLPIITEKTGSDYDYSYSINPAVVYNTSFTNQIGTTNAGGSFKVDGNVHDIIPSGQSRNLVEQRIHNAETNNERFVNWSGSTDYKHHHWNTDFVKNKLINSFQVASAGTQYARFVDMNYGKIEARLDGAFISGKGNFQFQDPWYALSDNSQPTNYWVPASGMYEPTGKEGVTDKGVFLNQGVDWQPPYYSVKANQTQSINLGGSLGTRDFYFLDWSANPTGSAEFQYPTALETPVVFKSANATVQANLKGHLLSGVTSGFSTNSQRKIVRTNGDGKLHMVYESMGSVWYTISTDGGSTWGQEQRVNPYGTNAKDASIAESDDGLNYVYIVYQIDREVFPYIEQGIILAKYQYGVQQWVRTVYELSSYSYDTKPVVAAQNNVAYVVFKPTSTSVLLAAKVMGDGTVNSSFSLSNTTSSSVNPSLTAAVQNFYLAYQNGNTEIRYFKFYVNGTIVDYAVVSSGSGFTNNVSPSLSTHAGDPVVSWSGYNSGVPTVVIKRKTGTTWSTFRQCDNGAAAYPSNNNSRSSGSDGSIIAWTNMYNQSRCIKFVGGNYTSIYNLPSSYWGQDVQLGNGLEFNHIKAVSFDRNVPAPYPVKPIPYNFNTMQKTTNGDEFNYARLAVINKNNSEIVYGLGDVKMDGKNIRFIPESDMIKITDAARLTTAMATESFPLSSTSKLEFSDCAYVIKRDKAQVSTENIKPVIELVNSSTGEAIKVKDIAFETKDTIDARTYYKLDCASISNGEYYLRVKLIVKENYEFCLSDCIYEENKQLPKKQITEIVLAENSIPKEYSLEQNYPNPFNPTTTINYQIKEDGLVTLKLYDVIGEEIMTLVNEEKTTGRY
ncbi:MAG: hypothetical protein HXY50_06115, partial [Ignavibacteriaceae bacterium]|nr:hypothetical protein [Ignavibacteriaceae bacterium]